MEPSTAGFLDRSSVVVQILEESQAYGTGFFGVIPEIIHAFHELALEYGFV